MSFLSIFLVIMENSYYYRANVMFVNLFHYY